MKYVKQNSVIKAVEDHMASHYVAAGWEPSTKEEYEAIIPKTEQDNPVRSKAARNPGPYDERP